MDALPVGAAIAGGVLPALAWLWFWRREDDKHPEPRRLIALAFLAGMVTVAVVIPIEQFVAPYLTTAQSLIAATLPASTFVFLAWSAIEEICKYLAARWSVLRRREDDEPIDPVIYMVTVALGFAAVENSLFLLSPLAGTTLWQTIQTGDLRFVGATLLHVLASSVIGVALGLSFYKRKAARRRYAFWGVILAIALHGSFNFLILNTPESNLLRTFGLVWIGLVALLGILEYIKRIRPRWA
jgi:RsiW-degrading membrane proteinase PrsW (M82 family)